MNKIKLVGVVSVCGALRRTFLCDIFADRRSSREMEEEKK